MEIKVTCACGTRYKFDVEPVNGRMPWPVNCPACGAEGTEQANEIISQTPQPAAPAPIRVAAPVVAAQAAAPPPGGLRINRTAPEAASAAPPPPPPPSRPMAPGGYAGRPAPGPKPPSKASSVLAKVGSFILVFLVVAFAVYKVVRKVGRFSSLVSGLEQAGEFAKVISAAKEWNLTADDQVILYIKHTNHQEVAQACIAHWKENLNRSYRVISSEQEAGDEGEYSVYPAHNGYVRVMAHQRVWKEPQFEAAAKHLSEKFNTMIFIEKDVDFNGAFVFGVYENGTNDFHARMDVKIVNGEDVETVTTEHNEWAVANGYKPGKNGFKEFNVLDANELTKKFGMKFWDEPEGPTNYLVMVEATATPAPGATRATAPAARGARATRGRQ